MLMINRSALILIYLAGEQPSALPVVLQDHVSKAGRNLV